MALGEFVNSHTGLLDNMGAHAGEVRTKFCAKLADAKIYFGKGTIGNQDFLFVYFPISGQEAFTIIAVHIEAQGDKLLIERRRYVKLKTSFGVKAWILIVFATVATYGFYLLLLLLKPHKEWLYRLDAGRMRENQALMSQTHDVTALSLLKDAIKDCGGTDAMIPYI